MIQYDQVLQHSVKNVEILGYVIAVAIIIILASLGFMATVSADLTSAATTMASILIVVALLVGVAAASKAARDA